MFKCHLESFVKKHGKNWTLEQTNTVYKEMVRYFILGGTWEMRSTIKSILNKEMVFLIEKEITSKFHNDNNYYSLWRAVIDHLCTEQDILLCGNKHQVRTSLEDIYFCKDNLTNNHIEQLKSKALEEEWQFNPLDRSLYAKSAIILKKFSSTIAYKKLHFISKYDRGICHEDFTHDLWEEGCRIYLRKWQLPQQSSRLNYARRAIVNKAIDIIHEHTHEAKARLGSYVVPQYLNNSSHINYERYVTTLSIDRASTTDETQSTNLYNICQTLNNPNETDHMKEVVEFLGQGLEPKYQTYLAIISFEFIPDGFEQFIKDNYSKSLSSITTQKCRPKYWKGGRKPKSEDYIYTINYRKLGKLAQIWLDISQKELEYKLGKRLKTMIKEQGGSDLQAFNSQESLSSLGI